MALVAIAAPQGVGAQSPRFVPDDRAAVPERRLEVREHDGSTLRAEGARLLRTRNGVERELPCTEDAGTGRILELVAQRGGATFLAAERGVFVIAPEVEHVDAIHRADGGPRGAPPTGIALSLDGRTLWICERDTIGCLDTVQFYGRTLPETARPRGAISDVHVDPSGRVLCVIERAVHVLRAAEAPRLVVETVEGAPFEAGRAIACSKRSATVNFVTTPRDGCTLRIRKRGHHLWRPFEGNVLERLEPGRQRYELLALDAALQRSAPVQLELDVPYPKAFDKTVLVPIALLWIALLAAAFALAARRGLFGRFAWSKAAMSTILAFFVTAQIATGLVPHARSWPFVGFTMYTQRFEERSLIFETKFVGIEADGSHRLIKPVDAGRSTDGQWTAALPLVYRPQQEPSRFLRDYNRNTGSKLVGVQIVEYRKRLTHRGPLPVAPILWVNWRGE